MSTNSPESTGPGYTWTAEQSAEFDRIDAMGIKTAAEIREELRGKGFLPRWERPLNCRPLNRSKYNARAGKLLLEVLNSDEGLDKYLQDPEKRAELVEAGLLVE